MANVRPFRSRRGHAVVEVALLAPWIFFLFIGVLDFGFYAYAVISVENAARVAALWTSAGQGSATDNAGACQLVLEELRALPNVGNGLQYPTFPCASLPVIVNAQYFPAGGPGGTDSARVTVTYQSVPMIPMPGMLSQLTITRFAEMRVGQ